MKDWKKTKEKRKIPDQRSKENERIIQKGIQTKQTIKLNNKLIDRRNKESTKLLSDREHEKNRNSTNDV